jgi:hypothetical protein
LINGCEAVLAQLLHVSQGSEVVNKSLCSLQEMQQQVTEPEPAGVTAEDASSEAVFSQPQVSLNLEVDSFSKHDLSEEEQENAVCIY